VVRRGRDGIGSAYVAAVKKCGWKRERSCAAGFSEIGRGGNRCGQQTLDELGAAVGDNAELGGVVLMLGTKDAGNVEEIAVETEGGEEVAGVVSQTGGFGERGRAGGRGWR
jgi:hypothetical protein